MTQPYTQPSLFAPESSWTALAPNTWPKWPAHGRVAVDVETKDPDLLELGPGWTRRGTSHIIGVSVSIEDGPSFYLPVAHEGGDNVENPAAVWEYLRTEARAFKGTLLNHHIQYDLLWLAAYGVGFPNVSKIRDTEIAEVLLDDLAIHYNLEACCQKHDLPGKDEGLLTQAAHCFIPAGKIKRRGAQIDVKGDMWRLPARYVGPYAEQDTRAVLHLSRRQERCIDQDGLWEAYNLESDVIPVIAEMTRRGVAVSEARLDHFEKWATRERAAAVEKFNHIMGSRLQVSELTTPAAIARILTAKGIDLPPTKGGGNVSVDKRALAQYNDHEGIASLLEAKQYDTALGKFVVGTRRSLVNGRIHASFNQSKRERGDGAIAGAVTGRLSSSNPNLQNQPNRGPLAKPWRSIFLPDDGGIWACCDYSEQEPRLTVHYAETFGFRGARAAGDRYRNDPTTSFHSMMAEMSGRPREQAKTLMLGISYGMGIAKLAASLGVNEVAAERIYKEFTQAVPFILQLSHKCREKAARDGWIPTLMGRVLRFPKNANSYAYEFTHKAMNRLIQGSAAMQTKKAMVDAHRAGFALQLQVHDELDQTVSTVAEAHALADVMRNAVLLKVPSQVTVKTGPSWGELKAA